MSIYERVIQDLEILLHLQRKYIWTLEKQTKRMFGVCIGTMIL